MLSARPHTIRALGVTYVIGVSLSKPHSNVESGGSCVKNHGENGIATHHCSLGMVIHIQTT